MQASYSLSQPVLPVKSAAAVDLLFTFRVGSGQKRPPRRPLNLSLVIDRSGSMAGQPLRQALGAAETLVQQLRDDDVVSVVVYDDNISTIVPPRPADDKKAICQKLRTVQAGGTTNLHGGWQQGCEHVLAHHGGPTVRRVLLLTDGQANVGVTEPARLIESARKRAREGVVTTTLGFGPHFNEDLLIGMAEAAGGNFYFIEAAEDAAHVFQVEGESLTAVVAQNLTVTLKNKDAKAKLREVLNNYPAQTGAASTTILLGDVYAGEDKLLALEIEVPAQAKAQKALPLFDVSYTYEPAEGDAASAEGKLAVTAAVGSAAEAASAQPADDVLLQIGRIRIARAKGLAVEEADAGRHAQAADALRRLIDDLRRKGLDERFEIAEEIAQLEHFADKIARRELDTAGRKEMRDQSYQGRVRSRADLAGRGGAGGSARGLETTTTADGGVELECVRQGGKLRMRVVSKGYDPAFNVQFPRNIREEGVRYVVEALETSKDGTFYRTAGKTRRLVRSGEPDRYAASASKTARTGKASKVTARTAADLEMTDAVGDGVLVQCVKEGSKVRARVVSDGYDPDYNMRFPRDIRQEGVLYVVDEVIEGPGGTSYIACGKIRRLVQ